MWEDGGGDPASYPIAREGFAYSEIGGGEQKLYKIVDTITSDNFKLRAALVF